MVLQDKPCVQRRGALLGFEASLDVRNGTMVSRGIYRDKSAGVRGAVA